MACECRQLKGVYTIHYSAGACEAVVKCTQCGGLYYSLLFEQMGFDDEADVVEEYQIPISEEEFVRIKGTPVKDLNLAFLEGRRARVFSEVGMLAEISSGLALSRCNRK